MSDEMKDGIQVNVTYVNPEAANLLEEACQSIEAMVDAALQTASPIVIMYVELSE